MDISLASQHFKLWKNSWGFKIVGCWSPFKIVTLVIRGLTLFPQYII